MLTTQSPTKARKGNSITDAIRFAKNPLKFIQTLIAETNGASVIPFKTGPLRNVFLNDSSLVREMLNNYEVFEKTSITYTEIRKMFDNGIIFSNGEEWRHNRKAINPSFHKRAIENYFKIFSIRGAELVTKWKARGSTVPVNIYTDFVNTTVDITLDVFFDHHLSKTEKEKVVRGIDLMLYYTQKRLERGGLKFPDFIPVPENITIRKARNGYHEVMRQIFAHKKNKGLSEEKATMIDLLISAESYYGGPMTDEQIIAEASSIMLAGTETTASLLTWMFFEMAKHPEVKKNVSDEIRMVFAADRTVTIEKLKQLTYCRQTINETLRLYPPAWILTRKLSSDSVLGTTAFKKGTTFFFSPYILQRDPVVWPDPSVFDPTRFAAEKLSGSQKANFIPFAAGPRKCIGEEFSIWEALTIMVETIPHFDWLYPKPQDPAVEFSGTIRPLNEKGEHDVPMILHARH